MSKFILHSSVIEILETLRESGNPLSEKLILGVKKFIKVTPIDFTIIKNGAFRTAEEQNEIFKKVPKVTNCDGYKYKSYHQSGLAVDLVPYVDNAPSWDESLCRALGAAFKTFCNIEGIESVWGGDWEDNGVFEITDFDPCHHEIRG